MKKRIPNYFKVMVAISIILGIVVLSALLTKINSLDPESEAVQNIYAILGDNYLDYCDGMPFYNNSEVNLNTLEENTKMCLAYKHVSKEQIENSSLTKAKRVDGCNFTKDKQFRLDKDEKQICSTEIIALEEIKSAYQKIFGTKLEEYTDFNLSGSKSCFYDEEKGSYTCGNVLIQTIELGWAPTTYRLITKAKEKGDKILIYDYYLAVNNDRCYLNNFGTEENEKCSNKINGKTNFTSRLVSKYGRKYLHTFAPSDDGSYYWVSSTPTN